MLNKDYIMLGNGGHASVLRDIAELTGCNEIGYVLGDSPINKSLQSSCLGDDKWLLNKSGDKPLLINGLGYNPYSEIRNKIFDIYKSHGFEFLTMIHPSAHISKTAKLETGVQVMAGSVIQANSVIKSNTIINTHSSIDHDCFIDSGSHIAPGSIICGNVTIGQRSFIGASTCIIPGIDVGSNVLIGAGTTVIKNIPDNTSYFNKNIKG